MNVNDKKSVNEFILPSDGVVVMPDSLQMPLADPDKCVENNPNTYVALKQTQPKSWFDTKNWIQENEPLNVAKPHLDRIPCECDSITFPIISGVSIDLELVEEIVADKIQINNRIGDFTQFLETHVGQRMFANSEAVRFEQGVCRPPQHRGCHNTKRFFEYYGIVCENEKPRCGVPHCIGPIKPRGHCCPICAAALEFRIRDDPKQFQLNEMERIIQSKLRRFRSGKYANSLHYSIGFYPETHDDQYVQVVIAEVDEYQSISAEFLKYITKDAHFQGKTCSL